MTLLQIYQRAVLRFGEQYSNKQGRFTKDDGVLAYTLINEGYREICRRANCSRTNSALTTSSGIREYSLPSNMASLSYVEYLPTGETIGVQLERIDHSDISTSMGAPFRYYQPDDNYIGFDPMPDAAYAINYWFYQKPIADLTSGESPILIPSEWHHLLIFYTVMWFYRTSRDDLTGGAEKWERFYETELRKFKQYLREGVNADAYIGVR